MFWKHVTVLLLLQLSLPTEAKSKSEHPKKALQFGTTLDDFIKWYPDMTKVKNAVTVCAWIKKQLTNDYRTWFSYKTSKHAYEICISDSGYYNHIHNDNLDLRSSLSVPLNTWTYQCNSWSTTSGTNRIYYNGTQIGYEIISNTAPLEEGGYITLGHDGGSKHVDEVFGGQMIGLNIFGKELREAEIKELYNAGRCSDVAEKKHNEVRHITWESVLRQTRTGNVTVVDAGCPAPEEEEEETKPHSKLWDILYEETYFNKTLTEEKLAKLKSVWNILDHFVGSRISEGIIAHLKMFHGTPNKVPDLE